MALREVLKNQYNISTRVTDWEKEFIKLFSLTKLIIKDFTDDEIKYCESKYSMYLDFIRSLMNLRYLKMKVATDV